MLSQQTDLMTFQQTPMALIGSISFLKPHRSFKRCAPLHKSNLWKILDCGGQIDPPEKNYLQKAQPYSD